MSNTQVPEPTIKQPLPASVRSLLTQIFAHKADVFAEYKFGRTASPETVTIVQLMLLLTQKVQYKIAKPGEPIKGIFALRDYAPHDHLRSDSGEQVIDELLTRHSSALTEIRLSLTKHEVSFQAIYPDKEGQVYLIHNVVPGIEDPDIAHFISTGGLGEQLTAKCVVHNWNSPES